MATDNSSATQGRLSKDDAVLNDLGCLIEQAGSVLRILMGDSQGSKFSIPAVDIFLALCAIERMVKEAGRLQEQVEAQDLVEDDAVFNDLGFLIDQACGVLRLLIADSQGLEFSIPAADIFSALCAVERLVTEADRRHTQLASHSWPELVAEGSSPADDSEARPPEPMETGAADAEKLINKAERAIDSAGLVI